jgi:transcriptional regulator with XRE-family HTH domain
LWDNVNTRLDTYRVKEETVFPAINQVDPRWWVTEAFHGVALRERLAARDFGPIFGFLKSRGWSVAAIAAATRVQEARVREIMAGRRKVTSYEVIERIATGLDIDRGLCGIGTVTIVDTDGETEPQSLCDLIGRADDVDGDGLSLLQDHTDHIRVLNRGVGADIALPAVDAHLDTLCRLRSFSLDPAHRKRLSELLHDAACLAAGLCRDQGDDVRAWRYHETAKDAAREADNRDALAHSLAQQAELLAGESQAGRRRFLVSLARRIRGNGSVAEVTGRAEATHVHGPLYRAGSAPQLRRARPVEVAGRALPEQTQP